jgi:F-type H+-transporting ATPase subunit c
MKKTSMVYLAVVLAPAYSFAQDAAAGAQSGGITNLGLYALSLALILGLGALGATLAQGRVGASAMEGLARNPQAKDAINTPMLLSLALIESLFILTWLIAFLMQGKI